MRRCLFVIITFYYLIMQSFAQPVGDLKTPWYDDVDFENVLPEYPRPQLVRAEWKNLNGVWEFQEAFEGEEVPFREKLKEEIIVPFPWESQLSGIRRIMKDHRAWYKRFFSIPESWKGKNIILHFGAVDWQSTIYVNGRCVEIHRGGYDPFSINITKFINYNGNNELIVGVWDPGSDKAIASGKQTNSRFYDPQRYSYTPSSGIWQTVWLEPVSSNNYFTSVRVIPDIDAGNVNIKSILKNSSKNSKIEISVLGDENNAGFFSGSSTEDIIIDIDNPRLWSPDDPFLYDLQISLIDTLGNVLDEIKSYFGMRKVSVGKIGKVPKILLNNEFLFQMGPLDQGYWPDGLYTAPTDEALKWDIAMIKDFGFNMIRKHVKIEPARWYYWADKLGVLVWQDFPHTWGEYTEEDKTQFELELHKMVKTFWNHPSIIIWVVFNEHWGLFDVHRLTENIMALDETRLVIGNSGIDAGNPNIDYEVGHIKDNHSYRPPSVSFVPSKRAVVNGEYGAIGYLYEDHVWDTNGPWVHYNYEGKDSATVEYERFIKMIHGFRDKEGLSAAVYTQWTDLENEMNGIYTYDRKKIKLHKDRITKANKSTYDYSIKIND